MPYKMTPHVIHRRNQINAREGGSTPFHSSSMTFYQNLRGNRTADNIRSLYMKPKTVPKNHNWAQEHAAVMFSEDYESTGMVVWVDGIYGEILCEKNLRCSYAHFYFDGSTVIDEKTVAEIVRERGTLGLLSGAKIEFECKYIPPNDKTTPYLVRVLKIFICNPAPDSEVEHLCNVSYPINSHTALRVVDQTGSFALLSPVLFSKNWILECLKTTIIGVLPDYPEFDNSQLIPGRTFMAKTMRAPRWMLDGGETGNPCAVRKIILEIIENCEEIAGIATVVHVVPRIALILLQDDLPRQYMFYPMSTCHKFFKDTITLGDTVRYVASRDFPPMSYDWRVMEIAFLTHPVSRSLIPVTEYSIYDSKIPKKVRKAEREEEQVKSRTQMKQKKMRMAVEEQTKEEKEILPVPRRAIENVKYLIQMEPSASEDTCRKVLGCSRYDTNQIERCQAQHRIKLVYDHEVVTTAEKIAEEQRRQREELKEAEAEQAREELEAILEEKLQKRKTKNQPVQLIPPREVFLRCEKLPAELEAIGVRIVGLYDDVTLYFERELIKLEEKKRREAAEEKAKKQKKTDEPVLLPPLVSDSFWFRRRSPRLFPTILVAELCSNRSEQEICRCYLETARTITETIVLRNPHR